MVGCCGGAWNAIERVKGLVSCWSINEDGISIGVGYRVLEGYSPMFGLWTAPSFEDSFFRNSDVGCFSIVDIYFVTVANVNVSSVSKLASTQKGLVRYRWDNIDSAGCLLQVMFEKGNGSRWGGMAVGKGKYLVRQERCRDEGSSYFSGV